MINDEFSENNEGVKNLSFIIHNSSLPFQIFSK
jgi:hypothetical protein